MYATLTNDNQILSSHIRDTEQVKKVQDCDLHIINYTYDQIMLIACVLRPHLFWMLGVSQINS